MDYKVEYQKALERAKKGLPIDEVFPELKASEDERIIDDAIQIIRASRLRCAEYGAEADKHLKAIAYLEKQKERERIVPEREATDFEIEVHEIIAQARSDKRLADKDALEQFEKEASCALMWKAEKQKEQKPVEWSEEDEKMLEHIISDLREFRDCETDEELVSDYEDEITWLKSLSPQFHWKPSEEQMEALLWCAAHLGGADHRVLAELYEHLKKLI